MSLNKNDLVKLAKTVARANPSSPVAYSYGEDKFSYSELNETLRSELRELAGTYALYREHKFFRLRVNEKIKNKKTIDRKGDCKNN